VSYFTRVAGKNRYDEPITKLDWGRVIWVTVVVLVVTLFLSIGSAAGCKEYNRYQKRADAKNNVKVTNINIQRAEQQAKIVRAEIKATQARAEKRVAEAHGIRQAQDLIAKTLTPLYVQHEAIQAQKIGGAGDRTYIPVGPQGVPLVADVAQPSLENPDR
jgi:hypothetical protein